MLASFFEEAVLNVIEVFTRISHGTVRNAQEVPIPPPRDRG